MRVSRESVLPYMWMLCGSFAFACMGILANALGESCDWQVVALARSSLPLLFVLALSVGRGVKLVVWKPPTLWVRSVAGSVSLVCTFYALTRLPVSDVFTLTNMFPLWVALLSWPLLQEPPSGQVWLPVASGVAGVVLMQQPHLAGGSVSVSLIALGSSLSTAVAMMGLHRLRHVDVRAIVVHFSAVSFLFSLGAWFFFERRFATESVLSGWNPLMILGIGVTATIGQIFLTKAFTAGPPAKVSVVGLSQVIFALGLGVLFLHQPLHPMTLLGMAFVMAPTAWLMLRTLEGPAAKPVAPEQEACACAQDHHAGCPLR